MELNQEHGREEITEEQGKRSQEPGKNLIEKPVMNTACCRCRI